MVDLNLPDTVDSTRHSVREGRNSDKFAIYALFPLQDGQDRRRLEELLASDEHVGDMCQFCTDVQFPSSALKDVLDHHLSNAERQHLNPELFIVVHTRDFEQEGALLINANVDLKGSLAKVRLKIKDVLLDAVNIQIANVDWDELPSLDPQPPVESLYQAEEDASQQPGCFGIYGVVKGANLTATCSLLEPNWQEKHPRFWKCEAVGTYDKFDEEDENIAEVVKWHPWHCHRITRMNRQWCICVNTTNPTEYGVLLLRIGWDERLEREPKELLEVGRRISVEVEPVRSALQSLSAKQ